MKKKVKKEIEETEEIKNEKRT